MSCFHAVRGPSPLAGSPAWSLCCNTTETVFVTWWSEKKRKQMKRCSGGGVQARGSHWLAASLAHRRKKNWKIWASWTPTRVGEHNSPSHADDLRNNFFLMLGLKSHVSAHISDVDTAVSVSYNRFPHSLQKSIPKCTCTAAGSLLVNVISGY